MLEQQATFHVLWRVITWSYGILVLGTHGPFSISAGQPTSHLCGTHPRARRNILRPGSWASLGPLNQTEGWAWAI